LKTRLQAPLASGAGGVTEIYNGIGAATAGHLARLSFSTYECMKTCGISAVAEAAGIHDQPASHDCRVHGGNCRLLCSRVPTEVVRAKMRPPRIRDIIQNNEIGDAGKNTVEVLLVVLQVGCIEVRYYAL
jgi:hypothetical protein